jgi:hypothetical protein
MHVSLLLHMEFPITHETLTYLVGVELQYIQWWLPQISNSILENPDYLLHCTD